MWKFWWIVGILLAVWVYSDAKARGSQQALFWGFFAFMLPLLGVPVYFLIGRAGARPTGPGMAAGQAVRKQPARPGTGALRAPGTGALKLPAEPAKIEKFEDLMALVQRAQLESGGKRPEEAIRLMGRVFSEASLADVKVVMEGMAKVFLDSHAQRLGADLGAMRGVAAAAGEAVAQDDFPKAYDLWKRIITRIGQDHCAQGHPAGILVLAGLKATIEGPPGAQLEPREAAYRQMMAEATQAVLEPDGMSKTLILYMSARTLFDPAATPEAQARVARLDELIAIAERHYQDDPKNLHGVPPAGQPADVEARYKALTEQGTNALMKPGGSAEAARCFELALLLLGDPPDDSPKGVVRGRVLSMIQTTRSMAAEAAGPPAPPADALGGLVDQATAALAGGDAAGAAAALERAIATLADGPDEPPTRARRERLAIMQAALRE